MMRSGVTVMATMCLAWLMAGCGGAPGQAHVPRASGFADVPPVSFVIDVPRTASDVVRSDRPRAVECTAGRRHCGEVAGCRDLVTDRDHCGACGASCGPLEECAAGVCTAPSDLTTCDGVPTDLLTNARHCGRCFNECTDGLGCVEGACQRPARPPTHATRAAPRRSASTLDRPGELRGVRHGLSDGVLGGSMRPHRRGERRGSTPARA
nr:hypothetical protein [Deltaproteobacteria bacterium]